MTISSTEERQWISRRSKPSFRIFLNETILYLKWQKLKYNLKNYFFTWIIVTNQTN